MKVLQRSVGITGRLREDNWFYCVRLCAGNSERFHPLFVRSFQAPEHFGRLCFCMPCQELLCLIKLIMLGVAPVQLIQDARGKIFSQFLPQCFYFFLGVYCVYFISGLGGPGRRKRIKE